MVGRWLPKPYTRVRFPLVALVFSIIFFFERTVILGSLNKVFLMGNLTRDVEMRYTPSGTAVADIGVAVNERRKDAKGETVEETTFVEVTLWARTAEVAAEYLKKGSPVLIEGRLKLDVWEAEGVKRSKLKVVCSQMQMVGAKAGNGGGHAATAAPDDDAGASADSGADPVDGGDGIPF